MRAIKLWPLGAAILLAGGAVQAAEPAVGPSGSPDVGCTDIT